MKDIGQAIEDFAAKGVYIDMVIDAYKFGMKPCYRGCIEWKENGEWKMEDAGCYPSWEEAFNSVIELADLFIEKS